MRMKLTKTIATIVFVVFLGLIKTSDVDAFYAYCHYKSDDGNARALISINDSFKSASGTYISTSSSRFVSVKNWSSSGTTSTEYFAYDDAWKNDHCPQYLIYATKGSVRNTETLVYMSDSANLETYKTVMSSYYTNIKVLSIDSNTFPNGKSDYGTYIPERKCECKIDDNEISYTIADDGDLGSVTVGGKTVQNWVSITSSASIDLVKHNECLDLIYSSGKSKVYLSNSANYENVYKIAGSGHSEAYKCELSSETPVNVEKPKPEYNPPTVNTGIITPLNPNAGTYSCGNGYMTDIPSGILRIIRIIYIILQILVPITLVILGSMDLVKSITSQKEDEIKRGQNIFIKRLIAAIIIFFVFIIVKLVVGVFSNDDNEIISCMNCFLDGVDSCD